MIMFQKDVVHMLANFSHLPGTGLGYLFLDILAYMATSGGHFSRPLGMGGYRSYSG